MYQEEETSKHYPQESYSCVSLTNQHISDVGTAIFILHTHVHMTKVHIRVGIC